MHLIDTSMFTGFEVVTIPNCTVMFMLFYINEQTHKVELLNVAIHVTVLFLGFFALLGIH